jgi:hypothetical protein
VKTPKRIMDAARGEPCTLNIAGVCSYDNETTVVCHLPDGSGGSNRLTGPLSIAFGCSECHDVLDGRTTVLVAEDREFYMRRGQSRTINRLIEMGLVRI